MFVDDIRKQFIEEARNSPTLLADLANMESYISESYSGRSLIELLQNADDAGASKFYVEATSNNEIIIANNGHEFNERDLLSLCRSGSSTKKRNGQTIGFRGIGFKSVINYSEEVYLFSNNYRIKFSKQLTMETLKTSAHVPLIRIPHYIESSFFNDKIASLQKSYNTVFLFKTKNSSFLDELETFQDSCMLFLSHIEKIIISGKKQVVYSAKRDKLDEYKTLVSIDDSSNLSTDRWLIINNKDPHCCSSIAFKILDGVAIPAKTSESFFHSFMPTKEKISIPIKINGDFSTDPSRTKIVCDEETNNAIDECAELTLFIVKNIILSGQDEYNLLSILSNANTDPLSHIRGKTVSDIFVNKFFELVRDFIGFSAYLQPSYLTREDYITICDKLVYKYFVDDKKIAGLFKFLKCVSIPELSLTDILKSTSVLECNQTTRIGIIAETINLTRFGSDKKLLDFFSNAKLFTTSKGIVPISQIDDIKTIDTDFLDELINYIGSYKDIENFFRKFGVFIESYQEQSRKIAAKIQTIKQKQFSKTETIPKWRSVEKNVAAVLQSMPGVVVVKDVSEQNLGYDLEVVLDNGERQFVEVKSVSSLGESISITNNEYATANQYQKQFFLAITCQSDNSIEVCLINNPIYTLSLTKRVVRWEWICSQYSGDVIKKEFN